MMRRRWTWLALAVGLAVLAAVSAPVLAQEGTPVATEEQRNEAVEKILREQQEMLQGQRFTYDPAGRRDPFLSLLEKVPLKKGPRPKGVAGMLVSEIDLVGVVRDPSDGNIAFFTGSDNKGYFLRVGDEVYDGTLIAINSGSGTVTFRQQVDDPRLIKPYRDVEKRLTAEGDIQ
jgi:hypothetical protein